MTRWVARTLVIGLTALCGACTAAGDRVDVQYDEGLSQQLRELSADGGTANLADLTDFGWDTVHVFGQGVTADEVEQVVGEPVLAGDTYDEAGNLLVFMTEGRVVAARSIRPELLVTGDRVTWGTDTLLQPQSPEDSSTLRLVDPG